MKIENKCSVCRHPDRETVDRELVAGLTLREAADKYGLGKDAVGRHKRNHLSKTLKAVQERRETAGAQKAVDRAEELYVKASTILERSEEEGNGQLGLAAIKELRSTVELLAKLTGELDERPQVNVLNVSSSPEWLAIQQAMLEALSPFPEARIAVAGTLEELES
ncbi:MULTISPECIES: hypothetical protein [Brevibacterium]|uniref:Uncharacterized protein n=1 Tax=Brevibacterium antiquum CNRZ 918 TaxID=1255637 RepID=A0A2H1J2G2_9MICO|nr:MULTISPECIES: hypothetical protein [Brevibacterium]SMX81667.1 hypothetical protein BANT918_01361 [Brevibacterium antiquum CNRZ 918]HCG56410.1 hypothetical protein [Brevibacterium sp.]